MNSARPLCTDFAPWWFTAHWRDWHRGHGCDRDDGQPRSAEAQTQINTGGVPPTQSQLNDTSNEDTTT